jgi:alkanesulfonate monooxygenase SsuD/methylene tetrahydromethanopterin reductase-like flavin-dependent oxidoreductase (luciferase family)
MQLGMLLHPERGMDAVLEEARVADRQGFDSVWVSDHLMDTRGQNGPDGPFDSFTLMTAVGAVTSRTRLAWAMLNPSFHNPAVLAKRLSTLDHITHGRVICTLGAGWFKEEYRAYNLPLVDEHDERIEHEREVIRLLKELWTHPAPQKVTFEGKFVRCTDLPFNPAPFQHPHPPIWIGGDSDATLSLVKDLADGWVMLTSGNPDTLRRVRSAPDWPARPMTLVRNAWVFVAETESAAVEEASRAFAGGGQGMRGTLEEFLEAQVVGTPVQCLQRLNEFESWGINYVRINFGTVQHQEAAARLLLPLLDPDVRPVKALV